jgi:hypothetical protein
MTSKHDASKEKIFWNEGISTNGSLSRIVSTIDDSC